MIKIVDENGIEKVPNNAPIVSELNASAPVIPELQIRAIADVMGLETRGEEHLYADKIDTLLEWARTQTKDHSPEGIKSVIRRLEIKLGSPPLAEKKISYVARHAYLLMDKLLAKQERKMWQSH